MLIANFAESVNYPELDWLAGLWPVLICAVCVSLTVSAIRRSTAPEIHAANRFFLAAIAAVALALIVSSPVIPALLEGKSYAVYSGVQDALVMALHKANIVGFMLTASLPRRRLLLRAGLSWTAHILARTGAPALPCALPPLHLAGPASLCARCGLSHLGVYIQLSHYTVDGVPGGHNQHFIGASGLLGQAVDRSRFALFDRGCGDYGEPYTAEICQCACLGIAARLWCALLCRSCTL